MQIVAENIIEILTFFSGANLNYAGKFVADAVGPHSNAFFDFESLSRGDADTVTIPNARLLFSGDYQRSGADLIISDRDHRSAEKHRRKGSVARQKPAGFVD